MGIHIVSAQKYLLVGYGLFPDVHLLCLCCVFVFCSLSGFLPIATNASTPNEVAQNMAQLIYATDDKKYVI